VKIGLKSGSLLWTFTGAFLLVLILGVILQTFLVIGVVRPAARHWADTQAEALTRAGAEAVARALSENPAASPAEVLASVTRGRGPVILVFQDAEGNIVPGERRMGPRFRQGFAGRRGADSLLAFPPRRGPDSLRWARRIRARTPVVVDRAKQGEVVALIPRGDAPRWAEGVPRPWLLFLPIAALLSGGAGFLLFRILAAKLRRLQEHAEGVAAGDLTSRIPEPGSDEIGRLAQSLNHMTGSLLAARSQVEEAERQRRRFLADVTHELATPLTSIRGYAETLLDPQVPVSPEERTSYLKDILYEAQRMDLLVADLLDLARLEGGGTTMEPAEVDLHGLCRETVRRFQPLFQDAGLTLRWNGPEEGAVIPVRGDSRHLEQVMTNLLQNALRHVPAGRWAEVRLERESGRARIVVEDNGPGFPEQELTNVFDRFYRADPSRASGGTGLGLSIVREIVRMHHGNVWAENRPEGGARLIVELPTGPEAAA